MVEAGGADASVAAVRRWPGAAGASDTLGISVIIACWRAEQTIATALDCIARQRGLPDDVGIEVILVVDGRAADAQAITALLDARDPPFRFATTMVTLRRNLGAGLARRHGWALCRAPLVAFLDDDDLWHPDKLALQWAVHQQHPGQIASGHLCAVEPTIDVRNCPPIVAGSAADSIAGAGLVRRVSFWQLLARPRFGTTNVMIRRDLWPEGEERFRRGQDALRNLMIASRQPIMELPLVLGCRSPAATPYYADKHGLSRRRLRSRLCQWRNFALLVWRRRLAPWWLPPLLLWSIALLMRRYLLDIAGAVSRRMG